ncbi:uncharacterized protein SCHCODRAFT_02059560 [Schizophyllum commune H4-8]|uniref:uncharacterized protein n=1 Tax=Schizophyllum commune (strain H4-8 / FGSC 9210) TaxID=578458 RepID=UPI0021608386|nr:uncharacterized protein SCHCODRAFT_02059560 [Schizophyllum commune H4-8]KAI5888659.1 hypothetical protein SCHCODRAFT_02059560 [Schizophyllum commune H4-8]
MSTSNVFFPLLPPRRLSPAELACARPRRRARPVRAEGQTAGGRRRARRVGHGRAAIEVSSVLFPSLTCSSCTAMATSTCDVRAPRARRGQRARRCTRRPTSTRRPSDDPAQPTLTVIRRDDLDAYMRR